MCRATSSFVLPLTSNELMERSSSPIFKRPSLAGADPGTIPWIIILKFLMSFGSLWRSIPIPNVSPFVTVMSCGSMSIREWYTCSLTCSITGSLGISGNDSLLGE